ncbi:MAG: hypothetical protein HQ527_03085 [Cyanobacteria bacterium]|nr:hypothetical protein [Cyanobacteria bacterium bin.51]
MNTPIGSSSGSADLNPAPAASADQPWDSVETYFECITTCSLDDGTCITACVEELRTNN